MNLPPPLFAPPAPTAPDWRHAFGGVWRLTLRRYLLPGRWVTLLIGLAVLALLAFASSRSGGADNYLEWVIGFHLTFLVPALAFLTAAGAMRDELKAGTIDYVFTRPMDRRVFVGAKFVAHTVGEQIDFLLALAVVLAMGALRGRPDLLPALPGLLLGQLLLVLAFSALGFLAAILTNRYIFVGLAYAAVIEVGLGQIPTQISRLSLTRQIRDLFDASGHVASAAAAFGAGGAILLVTGVALAAAAAIFHRRELHAANET